jgi:TonB family protein
MNAILGSLIEINVAAGAAILLVLAMRRPMARFFGPHAAYALWAIVPVAMIATFLPERTQETLVADFLIGGLPPAMAALEQASASSWLPGAIGAAWIVGVVALGALLVKRQRAFMREADIGLAGPAIVGFRHPRIVTPDDFDRRFSAQERKLILTHEQVHLERSDARINALVALLRCAFWFNPLIHVGAKAMRIDQELSCDAEVVERRPRVRRAYAETLLKTHMTAQALPVGCHWPAEARHPLAERIDLLARKPASGRRRVAAAVLVVSLVGGTGVAAWAAQPERTIFRETANVVAPFHPVAQDAGAGAKPRMVPASFVAPVVPASWRGRTEFVADLCLSSTGTVESVAVVQSSGNARLDAGSQRALERTRFEPARRNGQAVAVCEQRVTLEFSDAQSPP